MELTEKLQLKPGRSVALVNAPGGVALPEFPRAEVAAADAILAFVTHRDELDGLEPVLAAARADRLVWLAYPKAGQLDTDLNRDRLAAALEAHGLQPARQISIDDTWSAMRFRPGA